MSVLRLISVFLSGVFGDNMRYRLVDVILFTIVFALLITPAMFESSPYVGVLDTNHPILEEVLNTNVISAQTITIDSDENFTLHGFTGSGTVGDPYVLEGQVFQDSLWIVETEAYFEIRSCQFVGGFSGAILGLSHLSNGLVSGCLISSGSLILSYSTDCILKDNIVFTESITDGSRMIFPGANLGWGINVAHTNDSVIEHNTVFHNYWGITTLGQNLTIRNNIIHSNLFSGLSAGALESLYVGNSIFGQVQQTYNIGTSGESAIFCSGENSTFYMNSIGWNDDHVEISTSGGIKPNQWDNGVDTGNAWNDYVGPDPYVLGTDNIDYYPSQLEDSVAPIINGPNDITREWGSPSRMLTWTIEEDFPTLYEIYFNNEFAWGGGIYQDTIQYPLTNLDLGTYNFTLKVFDAAGHTSNHTIDVEITPMNHNLYWGIEEDTTLVFDFYTTKDTTTTNTLISDRLQMTVTNLTEIPGKLDYIPICPYETEWLQANDTLPSLEYFFAGAGLVWAIISPAVPIGNWSLLSSFIGTVESEFLNISIIDDDVIWGIRIDIGEGDESLTSETTWFKSDGSLQKVILSIDTDVGSAEVTLVRAGMIDLPLTMMIVAGGIIGAVGVLVVLRSRRE
ncbi:MAG: right-handed parallel beta-helix repeat-containing protein [Candidatus Thorarchaeota archaeon]